MEPVARQTPVLSVIVPVYNGAETLRQCLTAICGQTLDRSRYEVVVIDDGSTDETPRIAGDFPVRLVRLGQNGGRIVARIRGATEAACERLVFCDSRVILEPDALATVLEMDALPTYAAFDSRDNYLGGLGPLFYCVYRRIWAPYFPQTKYADVIRLTEANFNRVPKGMGVFAVDREFFLRHQPRQTSRDVSDDTLLFRNMLREKPILRTTRLRATYLHRTDLGDELRHLFLRGALFNSYYLRPGKGWLRLYVAAWGAVAVVTAMMLAWPATAKYVPAGLAAALLAAAGYLAVDARTFVRLLWSLPLVMAVFGAGIIRGHWLDLRNRLGIKS